MDGRIRTGPGSAGVPRYGALVLPRRPAGKDDANIHAGALGEPFGGPRSPGLLVSRCGARGARVVPSGREIAPPACRATRRTSPANPPDHGPGARASQRI